MTDKIAMADAPKTAAELRDALIELHCGSGWCDSAREGGVGAHVRSGCRLAYDIDALLATARAEAIAELRAGVDVEACARAGYESDPGWRYQWDGINMYATTRDAHIRIARAVLRAAKVLP